MRRKLPAVYIMSNKKDGVLYVGVTSDLVKRVYRHKHSVARSFTHKYNCTMLVFYEMIEAMESAIIREKKLKNFARSKKIALIESINPDWLDLYEVIA